MTNEHPLSWRDRTVIRILFLIAGMIAEKEHVAKIETLATHIAVSHNAR